MTIKILKEGVLPVPKIKVYRGTCWYCRVEVEFDDRDFNKSYEEQTGKKALICPTPRCGKFIEVSETIKEIQILEKCKLSGCDKPHFSGGYCKNHYMD